MGCDAKCWTPVTCARCHLRKAPIGRSVPLEAANGYCDRECSGYREEPKAPHLWSVHDETRQYDDLYGWEEHVANCEECRR